MLDAGMVAVLAPFLMVVGIVWVKSRAQLEEKRIAAAEAGDRGSTRDRDNQRIVDLEERVRTLERIVTDRGYDVATQIEALRDQSRIEDRLEAREAERNN